MGSVRLFVRFALLSTCFLSQTTGNEAVCDAGDGDSTICRESYERRKNEDDGRPKGEDPANCGLYLAPSTIPGAGLGVFAGKELESGELIGYGDICIPLVDLSWHVNERHHDTKNPFEDHVWNGPYMGMSTETARGDVEAFCSGLEALANGGPTPNVGHASLVYDDCGFRRQSSISAGSFTPYFNVTSRALNKLASGAELFKDYVEDWFGSDEDARPRRSYDNDYALQDIDWLRSNGACVDNIRIGLSKIAKAGHGAFATRNLSAGTVITVSPLRIIGDRSFLNMYSFVERIGEDVSMKEWYRLVDESHATQLLLNYCFGHSQLDVLLCPYGAGVNLINHDKFLANVHVQWAVDFPALHNHSFVLQGTRDDLLSHHDLRIAFQYMALQDISEGDEMLMDYGDDWVAAWVTHQVKYNVSDDSYIDARAYEDLFNDNPLRTVEQIRVDPYPKNLQLRCHPSLLTQPIDMNATYVWSQAYGYPCVVLDYFWEFDRELYTIESEISIVHEMEGTGKQRIIITDVPRSATRFFDRPYSTDIHQKTAFRHAIGLPRSVVGQPWMTAD